MLPSKDVNFMGYTYKNFQIVNEHEVPSIGMVFYFYFDQNKYVQLLWYSTWPLLVTHHHDI